MPDLSSPEPDNTRHCIRAFVAGRVQGVGFRYATQREALRLGLAGWARNLADGRVEVLACGDPEAVEGLVAFLAVGPRYAVVTDIDVAPAPVEVSPDGFTVG